eukprot:gnl/TRDRNA2_/TRDRNA2_90789_c0_seq2.p1 gnl/TRDRNA2_/TRDRNA2_90789_c0~~gnl/TRDRNA2_/TRDRNA2_90789_c0_seq2.p1  ORF type:complete len:317 (+),score=45.39 gnl/TRDRNA2_/TRDRNA2_90789_c0_seq2:111-1061(+)
MTSALAIPLLAAVLQVDAASHHDKFIHQVVKRSDLEDTTLAATATLRAPSLQAAGTGARRPQLLAGGVQVKPCGAGAVRRFQFARSLRSMLLARRSPLCVPCAIPSEDEADLQTRWKAAYEHAISDGGLLLAGSSWQAYNQLGRGATLISYDNVEDWAGEATQPSDAMSFYVPLALWEDAPAEGEDKIEGDRLREKVVQYINGYDPATSMVLVVQIDGFMDVKTLTPRVSPKEAADRTEFRDRIESTPVAQSDPEDGREEFEDLAKRLSALEPSTDGIDYFIVGLWVSFCTLPILMARCMLRKFYRPSLPSERLLI